MKQIIKRLILSTLMFALLPLSALGGLVPPTDQSHGDYVVGVSTERSGYQKIWVPRQYSDVDKSHWFYNQLQRYRLLGILAGNENAAIELDRPVSAAEVYTFFARYVYSDTYSGREVNGAVYGDYTLQGKAAWLNAYEVTAAALQSTLDKLGKRISLPSPSDVDLTRGDYFVLYAVAALSRTKDPAWVLGQFSEARLGYYARSNKPIRSYRTGVDVTTYFTASTILSDANLMTSLEIQCANLLMYLGTLEGTDRHTLSPEDQVNRASAVKLLVTMDNMDLEPHRDEDSSSQDPDSDWGDEPTPPEPVDPEDPEEPGPEPEHHIAAILFADWDNNIIGSISVMTNTDIRAQISDYARDNFVHPDLRNGDSNDYSRQNTYRPDVKDEKTWALTRNLDYAFVRSPIVKMGPYYVLQPSTDEYQWAYGWAISNIKNYEDCWTTLGVAELADWDGSTFTNSSLTVLDPKKGIRDNVVLKPIFRPGPLLYTGTPQEPANYRYVKNSHWYYEISNNQSMAEEYGIAPIEEKAVDWSPRFHNNVPGFQVVTFERSYVMPDGTIVGVPKARQLTVDQLSYLDMTTNFHNYRGYVDDSAAENWLMFDYPNYSFHTEYSPVEDGDRVAVSIHATFRVHFATITLVDKWKSNFVAGTQRSATWRTMNNFNYDFPTHNPNYPAVSDMRDCVGTYGFAIDLAVDSLVVAASRSKMSFNIIYNYCIKESNLRLPDAPDNNGYIVVDGTKMRVQEFWYNLITAAIDCIYTHGHEHNEEFWSEYVKTPRVSWHQLQAYALDYCDHIFRGGPVAHVKTVEEAEAVSIPWCKLHFH